MEAKLTSIHLWLRNNIWRWRFAWFCRLALAAGFIPSGMVKILGERFTSLPIIHPMGFYLEALHTTGYYYTCIGIAQVTAALLLLIPRFSLLGAILYFPIILNITLLSLSLRFDGSLVSSPLMTLACLYLILWDFHRWKGILGFNKLDSTHSPPERKNLNRKFPWLFFGGSGAFVIGLGSLLVFGYSIMPKNTKSECLKQCESKENPEACLEFCQCVFEDSKPLSDCIDLYHKN